ncbi:uridine kinase [Wuchereria bancrofti]|uniref:Uridine kinase n=1 Tax=Wuchereria bancrofti TaxID=6293 RepID=J9FFT9_WUCBA|nr:uridine kinase [Wuchereria bancrofti]
MREYVERHVTIADPLSAASNGLTSLRNDLNNSGSTAPPLPLHRPMRTISGSKSEDHLITTESGRRIYTKGRPPWYDREGKILKQPYVVGICGGSASGKTTVARRIIERLEMPWVTVLSMDSFYKVLTDGQHHLAAKSEYNFDHPQAFDFDLMCETVRRLREGKNVEVPVYDFTTHRRDKQPKLMYGADILIFEGILAFHNKELVDLMDMKVFVDTDPDIRLARRLERDIQDRGRDLQGVLTQYLRFVKPAFDTFIAPGMKIADIIVPRGGENEVAIDLIVKQVKTQLAERGYDASKNPYSQRAGMVQKDLPLQLPRTLTVVSQTPQVRGLHTFIRDRRTPRDEFNFYSNRLMRILIENAMNFMRFEDATVTTPTMEKFVGKRNTAQICGVTIMRAGETMEHALRAVVKDCKMGKILIQTNEKTMEPELFYLRLPKNIHQYKVLLMDATVATGAAAMMAIRVLLDHDVLEENILLLSLLMAGTGVHSLAYAFPKVTLLTTAVDPHINELYYVIPGMGNFGDRYYGTEAVAVCDDSSGDEDNKQP